MEHKTNDKNDMLSKLGHPFPRLSWSYTQHRVNRSLVWLFLSMKKILNFVIIPEVVPQDLRSTHSNVITMDLIFLVFPSSCNDVTLQGDDVRIKWHNPVRLTVKKRYKVLLQRETWIWNFTEYPGFCGHLMD